MTTTSSMTGPNPLLPRCEAVLRGTDVTYAALPPEDAHRIVAQCEKSAGHRGAHKAGKSSWTRTKS